MSNTKDDKLYKEYKKAAKCITKAGMMPFPVNDTLIEILKFYLDEDDLYFINKAFRTRSSVSMEQAKKKLKKLSEDEIREGSAKLAKKGIIFNQPSSSGIEVFRLLPIVMIGTFEYQFMQNLPDSAEKKEEIKQLAELYDDYMHQFASGIQSNYDSILPAFENQPPVDRTVPHYENESGETIEINETIEAAEEVLPAQTVEEIIEKFDDIAVGNCFCRQYRKMLGEPCKINAPMETCFTFGKSARHTVEQGFARKISKEEALEILKNTEEAGLIHKAFHNGFNINRDENSICNCCKCCCDTFNLWRMGATPIINSTNYLSQIDQEICVGCGTCVERCPMDAISLNDDDRAEVNENHCIGCGLCARFCPEGAVSLKEGLRTVYIPPPRLE
ncbi:MAG: 4Fe-4S dicluster domain-containing protein [Promethearchaeota archaeon]|nr:MAG: 4Fe-4S dicluster domain-containing protein [Candidatus Lokiarchaeota archaeon]